MENKIFDTLEEAFKEAVSQLKGEQINAVDVYWGHGTITIQQATTDDPKQPYKGWELVEDT